MVVHCRKCGEASSVGEHPTCPFCKKNKTMSYKVIFNPSSAQPPKLSFEDIPLQGVFTWCGASNDKDRAIKISDREYVYPHTMLKWTLSESGAKSLSVTRVGTWQDGKVIPATADVMQIADLPVNTIFRGSGIQEYLACLYSIRTIDGCTAFYKDGSYREYNLNGNDLVKRTDIIGRMEVNGG